jgi:hypothetical protein
LYKKVQKFQFAQLNLIKNFNFFALECIRLYILETTLYCRENVLTQGSDIHQYETRARHAYRVAQHRTTAFEHLPSQVGVKFLNALAENLNKTFLNLSLDLKAT